MLQLTLEPPRESALTQEITSQTSEVQRSPLDISAIDAESYEPVDLNSADTELLNTLRDPDQRAQLLDLEKHSEKIGTRFLAEIKRLTLGVASGTIGVVTGAVLVGGVLLALKAFNVPVDSGTFEGITTVGVLVSIIAGMISSVAIAVDREMAEDNGRFGGHRFKPDGFFAPISQRIIDGRAAALEKAKDPHLIKLQQSMELLKHEKKLILADESSPDQTASRLAAVEVAQTEVEAAIALRITGVFHREQTKKLLSKIERLAAERNQGDQKYADEVLRLKPDIERLKYVFFEQIGFKQPGSPTVIAYLSNYFGLSPERLASIKAAIETVSQFSLDREKLNDFSAKDVLCPSDLDLAMQKNEELLSEIGSTIEANRSFEYSDFEELKDGIRKLEDIKGALDPASRTQLHPDDLPFQISQSQVQRIERIAKDFSNLSFSLLKDDGYDTNSLIMRSEIEDAIRTIETLNRGLTDGTQLTPSQSSENEIAKAKKILSTSAAEWQRGKTYCCDLAEKVELMLKDATLWHYASSRLSVLKYGSFKSLADLSIEKISADFDDYMSKAAANVEMNTAPAQDNFSQLDNYRQNLNTIVENAKQDSHYAYLLEWSAADIATIESYLAKTESYSEKLQKIKVKAHAQAW